MIEALTGDSMIYVQPETYLYLILAGAAFISSVVSLFKRDGMYPVFVLSLFYFVIGFLCGINSYHPQW